MFPKLLLAPSIIATIFFVYWAFVYPTLLWESLTFRSSDGIKGFVISILTIIFLLGFVNFFIFVTNELIK